MNKEGHRHTIAHNEFSDWSEEERAHFLAYGLATDLYNSEAQAHHYAHLEADHLPDRLDWVERGAVTYVRKDGLCAASWANAAVAAIEGAVYIRDGPGHLPILSTQQFIDCDHQSHGCNGGLFTNAFEHAMEVPVMLDHNYPYMAEDHECTYIDGMGVTKVKNYINVLPNDPE